jgi:biopolymer transport protein ExbD
MIFRATQKRKAPAVVIVSLIDVLMVVLIFLVITTTFKDRLPVIQFDAPIARNTDGTVVPGSEPLVVTIREQAPHLRLDNKSKTIQELGEIFRERKGRNPAVTLTIKADKNAPYGEVVSVTDQARSAGITNIYSVVKLPVDR